MQKLKSIYGVIWLIMHIIIMLGVMVVVHSQRPSLDFDVGTSYIRPRLGNFHADEGTGTTYAYSQDRSNLTIPGVAVAHIA
ncbi:MAG: hypothetical protein KAX40_10105 [Herpetosiphon sp.]|nr:hypothetical protein [Herpetosiphon sp.]